MNPQDRVLAHLGSNARWRIRLVARLVRPGVGIAASRTVTVFVPDLHLLSSRTAPKYPHYGTNAEDVLLRALFALRDARAELRATGDDLEVIQLGDLFDLWRERRWWHSGDPRGDIERSHAELVQVLYQHPEGLRAVRIVGNHDASLRGAAGFDTHRLIPADAPTLLVLHGHELDPREGRPEWLSELGVWIGARHRPNAYAVAVADVDDALSEVAAKHDAFREHLELDTPAELGTLGDPHAVEATEFAVGRTSEGARHPLLARARTLLRTLRSEGLPALRTMVVGHTHHARILIDDDAPDGGAEPLVLIDVGAWIENYRADGRVGPNCQLGILTQDEMRIYQLDPS